MAKRRPAKKKPARRPAAQPQAGVDAPMRIIGGQLKNKKIEYSGDIRTRPMKERVREAVFNLIGPSIKEKVAIDLFAGTGALGLEAISRGATQAHLIERHVPTSKLIRTNAEALEVVDQVSIYANNSFMWVKKELENVPQTPWVVFICPPYEFFVSRWEEMEKQINMLLDAAPDESILIVEFDDQFDAANLPDAENWDVRVYAPAHVGIYRLLRDEDEAVED
ncbi:RsmD family RNA methyltransferase [Bremerella sp. T1]|uniref:RsmD family RNA methyltransferase n=1 Tax=Bremerella sp. TYQ1 TaxID=3119568 RepID=UPI001CD00E0C|nr:RsmD family RNA methyltransferase [Bremerella volcania]UBM34752.1 RsmD family RNA methyltransferase [Bremerella volcania]